jgi:hypothetical protein
MARTRKSLWRDSPAGVAAYIASRATAQGIANRTGFDIGIECNELFRTWNTWTLPMRKNRCGHELTCEVVSCENLDRCQPGHGPRGV